MSATVALVGRPNVGKSTLFNKLTKSRDALVADVPGLTRDRRYGRCAAREGAFNLIDTGGLFAEHALAEELAEQTQFALDEADLVVALFDGREGITAADQMVVDYLRKANVPFLPVINKMDGASVDAVVAEFATFGFEAPLQISAAHNRGVGKLLSALFERLQALGLSTLEDSAEALDAELPGIRVAIVGRPNVGKSTLVNRLLGEARQVVYDMPGTTKDAIDIPIEREGTRYILIDTAGVRRKGRVEEVTEKFSVVKALEAMRRAHVVVLVLDASEGVVDQDLHVLQHALDAGSGMVVALNKWDGLDADARSHAETTIARKLNFVPWVPLKKISALHGTGVGHLWQMLDAVHAAGEFDVSTSILTRLLRHLAEAHPAPSVRGRQIKLKMATRGGQHPPHIVVHGNQLASLPASYLRYLENGFREALDLVGNPVKVELRDADNPFAGRRNELSRRQQAHRRRVIKHRKKRQGKGR